MAPQLLFLTLKCPMDQCFTGASLFGIPARLKQQNLQCLVPCIKGMAEWWILDQSGFADKVNDLEFVFWKMRISCF